METVAALRKAVTDTRYWSEPFERPLPGCMTSPFGVRRLHNGKRTGGYHGGIDQRGSAGTPIRAIADGVVAIVRPYNIHGNVVGIDHGQGVASLYLHMSKFATKEGAKVSKGDVIGYVGPPDAPPRRTFTGPSASMASRSTRNSLYRSRPAPNRHRRNALARTGPGVEQAR